MGLEVGLELLEARHQHVALGARCPASHRPARRDIERADLVPRIGPSLEQVGAPAAQALVDGEVGAAAGQRKAEPRVGRDQWSAPTAKP